VQCCVGRPATEEREEDEQQEPKAVVTMPWHARQFPCASITLINKKIFGGPICLILSHQTLFFAFGSTSLLCFVSRDVVFLTDSRQRMQPQYVPGHFPKKTKHLQRYSHRLLSLSRTRRCFSHTFTSTHATTICFWDPFPKKTKTNDSMKRYSHRLLSHAAH